MENKYYTPEISEFYVGFEYQGMERTLNRANIAKGWIENTYNAGYSLERLQETITKEDIRVKYLDKEDIESLGWKCVPDDSVGDGNFRWFDEFTLGQYRLTTMYHLEDENWQKESDKVMICDMPTRKNEVIDRMFNGKIKNKSALKVLMNQLGITSLVL